MKGVWKEYGVKKKSTQVQSAMLITRLNKVFIQRDSTNILASLSENSCFSVWKRQENRYEQLRELGACSEFVVKKMWNHESEAAVEYCAKVIDTSAKKKIILTLLTWNIQVDAQMK